MGTLVDRQHKLSLYLRQQALIQIALLPCLSVKSMICFKHMQVGQYKVVYRLGKGGFATVFLAEVSTAAAAAAAATAYS